MLAIACCRLTSLKLLLPQSPLLSMHCSILGSMFMSLRRMQRNQGCYWTNGPYCSLLGTVATSLQRSGLLYKETRHISKLLNNGLAEVVDCAPCRNGQSVQTSFPRCIVDSPSKNTKIAFVAMFVFEVVRPSTFNPNSG